MIFLFSIFEELFINIFTCMYVCLHECGRSEEGAGSLETGVTGSCKPPSVGAWYQSKASTRVKALLTTEPSPNARWLLFWVASVVARLEEHGIPSL